MNEQMERVTFLNREVAEELLKNNIVDGVLRIPDTIMAIGENAFSEIEYSGEPVHLTIPKSVVLIQRKAFSMCDCFKSVTFEANDSPVIMEEAVFECNRAIESVQFEDVVLGKDDFLRCTNLKKVVFNGVVPFIPACCFADTFSLEHIDFPEGLTEIMNCAFKNSGVTVDCFPKTLLKIGSFAFTDSNIEHVRFESQLKIEKLAFTNCEKLTEVHYEFVKIINEDVFSSCRNLVKVEIVNGDSEGIDISSRAFRNCKNLETFTLQNGFIKSIDSNAFRDCSSLKNIDVSKLKYISDNCFEGCRAIEEFDCSMAESIGHKAFGYCESLKSVKLSKKIKSIHSSAFYFCKLLEKINLPSSLTYLGAQAFSDCESLKSITIPCGIEFISEHTFLNCKSLKIVKFRKNIEISTIGYGAFDNCVSLKNIILPDSLHLIEDFAFFECRNLKSIIFGKNLQNIKIKAFKSCEKLETVSFPSTLEAIESEAFESCSNLKTVIFEDKMPYFKSGVFSDCGSLREIKISPQTYESDAQNS